MDTASRIQSFMNTKEIKLIEYALRFLNSNWDSDNAEDLKQYGINRKYLEDKCDEWLDKHLAVPYEL